MFPLFRFVLLALCLGGVFVSSAFAFTPDNRLLSKLYDQIDQVYTKTPDRVLRAYHRLPYARILANKNPELRYYLEKLEQYIHGKLFTFTEQPNFVCLDDYVQKNDTIEVDYTIKQEDNQLISTTLESVARMYGIPLSQIENRLAFNAGSNQVIPGMNQLILGKKINEQTTDLLEPKDAYGTYDESKRVSFTGKLAPELQISKKGERVMMQVTVDKQSFLLLGTVIEKTAQSALVDFNHPHAGESILLTVEVMNLFKACNQGEIENQAE